ncbi:sensor histidine kinase [Micromonospora krabiensis]|uniref:histidine kinase n=1 Tax=Micromonospora krabiensis TaxID=307121 RepID=A0A1C3MYE3_9ACTN|nr:histidine kinase [Micromonospora krabiensis]SBV25360.1 Signal transduction histidine kinase [Micromonospora krabiensis]
MLAAHVDRFFDRRFSAARLIVLTTVGAGDLLLLHRPAGADDWLVAALAFGMCLAAGVLPLTATAGLAGLLLLTGWWGEAVLVPVKVMAAIALFELAHRRSGREVHLGAALVAAVILGKVADELPEQFFSVLYRVGVVVGVPVLLGAYIRSVRAARREAQERAAEQDRRRRSEARAARADERAAIARELHDLVAHHVSSMVLRVGVARHVIPTPDPRLAEVLDDLHASGTAALTDLRQLVAVLRDPGRAGDDGTAATDGAGAGSAEPGASLLQPQGLATAVATALTRSRRLGLVIDATVDPELAWRLDAVRRLAVLRLVQEGLANVAKHAGPGTRVLLSLRGEPGAAVRLMISDDGAGRGGSPASLTPDGHGLIGMRERVALLGGEVEVGPVGAGWRLSAVLPGPGGSTGSSAALLGAST